MKYYYSTNGVNVYLIRDVRKKDSKSECPLRWCVYFNRKRAYYSTGISLNETDWELFEKSDETDFNYKSKAKHLKEYKDDLNNYFEKKLKPIIKELANDFSFEGLNNKLGKSDILNLNDAFQAKIDALISDNRIGNSVIYKTTKRSLEGFYGTNIPFSAVTVSFLNKYEKYLYENGLKTPSISMYMRTLRAVINNEGKPFLSGDAYPFGRGKYVPKVSKGVKVALTLKQIHAIEDFECKDTLTELCRDLWLFSFYASGMNFADIFRLKYTDIIIGELTFVRHKTRNTRNDETFIHVPILEPMKRIIAKYGNKQREGYIFPFLDNAPTETDKRRIVSNMLNNGNKRIKAICRELKNDDGTAMIPNYDLVNNYTARHSYATILNKLGVPESYIAQQLGHSNRSVTQGYFGEFDRDMRFKYNSLLINPEMDNNIRFLNVI